MLQTSAVRVCACVCVVAHDRWQSFELHSTTGWARPDKGREMPRWFFFLLSHVRLSSPSRCFSAHSVQLHFVTGGMVLTSEMPHGLFFFVSVFLASPHRVACTHCSSITPASEEGERGDTGRQVGKAASRPCGPTLPRWGRRVGMHSQVGVQGVAGHCLGYVLHNACTCRTVPAPYSITPQYARLASIYYSPTVPRPSISAQVGWRATAMTKTERGRQAGARRSVL